MKKINLFSSALIAGVLFASSAAMAAPQGHFQRVDVNIPRLDMRIDAGVKSGKLTRTEERQLRTELRRLGSAVKLAKNDHQVTRIERDKLERKEAALNRHITKLANNKAVVKKANKHKQHHQMPNAQHK